ncbi:chromosome condensation protein CrcB [Agromyces protaetiae]|uniref:Fluoride-specific ion channel FluC n=1 Tax=Agromyces protaetiae TaxID=2509455 RepID=A0A4P6FPX5_9MICO|nr:CrcB family protein [Agromyces protaetiae]QAY72568.1 chromosome condensation protein CrcB [Agromyces protaetiae]
MSDILPLVIAPLAGGVGAALRFFVDGVVKSRSRIAFPLGTAIINLTGSFALGLLVGFASGRDAAGLVTIVGVGLLGGYTTFSTASVETVRLAQEGRWRAALFNGFGVLVACVAAAFGGIALGLFL